MQLRIPPPSYEDTLSAVLVLTGAQRRRLIRRWVLFIIFFLLLGTIAVFPGPVDQSSLLKGGLCFLLCLVLLGAIVYAHWFGLPRSVRKMHEANPNRDLAIDDDAITMTTPASYSRYAWGGIHKVVEDEQFFFPFIGEQQPLIVPKRYLTPSQVEEVRSFLRARSLLP
jgi:hypothetical protein